MQKPDAQTLTKSSMHVACGRGSDLFWRRCDTLCTSGFVDEVAKQIAHNDQAYATRKSYDHSDSPFVSTGARSGVYGFRLLVDRN